MLNKNRHYFKRKRILNAKECEYDLRSIIPNLFKAYYNAIELYNKEIALTPPEARLRGFEARVLQAKIVQSIQKHFSRDWKLGKYKRFMICVKGYIIFFKKLNKYDMPMNIRTGLSSSIENQLQGRLFSDDEDGTAPILFFGYNRNKFGELVHPKLVYIDEGEVKWKIDETSIPTLPSIRITSSVPEKPTVSLKANQELKKVVNN